MHGDRWEAALLAKLRDGPPPAFILGGASSQALGFIRSLGRRGVPVIALSTRPGPRFWSRYCAWREVAETEMDLLARLLSVGRRLPGQGVIVATGDAEVLFLSRNRGPLGQYFHFVMPPPAVVEQMADKGFQCRFAAGIGVPVPATHQPETAADVDKLAGIVRFPCVVKPTHAHLWRERRPKDGRWRWTKAVQVDTPEELRTVCERMRQCGVDFLVQDRVEGDESRLYALYAYLDRRSEPLATCVIRKQRQWPPHYGSGSYSVTCRRDRVVELALTLLRRLGYQGVANVEFKLDPEDDELKFIEMNFRCGDRIGLALAAGVDIPFIAYRDILGEPVAAARSPEMGVSWINSLTDGAAVLSHYRRADGLGWWGWARTGLTARSHAYFASDDPVPFVANVVETARREAVPFCRAFRRERPRDGVAAASSREARPIAGSRTSPGGSPRIRR